jgi:hypothetical protein
VLELHVRLTEAVDSVGGTIMNTYDTLDRLTSITQGTSVVQFDLASGTVCLSSDGDTLRVGYTLHFGVTTEIGRLSIPHPSLTGGTGESLSIGASGTATFTGPASAEVCDPRAQPVP